VTAFNEIYETLSCIELSPLCEQLVDLLHQTWQTIKVDYCRDIVEKKRPSERASSSDIARVELIPDEVRCAIYSHINTWQGTTKQHLLKEWFTLSMEKQNVLLIEAFPDGRVYGV